MISLVTSDFAFKTRTKMSSEDIKDQNNSDENRDPVPVQELDPAELENAREVLQSFGKAFSAMKIYPPENPSVKNAIDLFGEKTIEFLDQYEELKIAIGEFSFSLGEETIFSDTAKKNSLPFLFFKDGMRELSFYHGLDKEEVQDFLETVQNDSNLSPEDSDIVNSLWEKDFAHIRYFALDEFLDSDIGGERGEDIKIDRSSFSSGTVKLTSEDEQEISEKSTALGFQAGKYTEEERDKIKPSGVYTPDSQITTLSEKDIPEIESMLSDNRVGSRMDELISLLMEILFLEDRDDQFSGTLNVLDQCLQEVIYKADFAQTVSTLNRILELREILSTHSKEKEKLLEKILNKTKDESSIETLKKLFLERKILDFDSFFQYMKILGPITLPLAGDIWEETNDPDLRLKVSNFLHEIGQQDINSLANLAQNNRIALTKEIITILGRTGDKKAIPHLVNFTNHQDKAIRLEAIQSLKKIDPKAANEILLPFLSDEDGEVRTMAAMNLTDIEDQTAFNTIREMVTSKDFAKKSKMEKKSLLDFLAMNQREDVYHLFQSLLKKEAVFSKSKQNETRLCAVSALEAAATPEAVNIIKEGTQLKNKIIQQACRLALRKISSRGKQV